MIKGVRKIENEILNNVFENYNKLPPPSDYIEYRSDSSNEDIKIPEKNSDLKGDKKPDFGSSGISRSSVSLLGFELYLDDIIILAIILFLCQDTKKDYLLIGILGLMFFDVSVENIGEFEPVKKLLNHFT